VTGDTIAAWKFPQAEVEAARVVDGWLAPAGDQVVTWSSAALRVYAVGRPRPIFDIRLDGTRSRPAISADGSTIAVVQPSSRGDDEVLWFRPPVPQPRRWTICGPARSKALSPDGSLLVVDQGNRAAGVFVAHSGERIGELDGMWTQPEQLLWHPTQPLVFAVIHAGDIQRWDVTALVEAAQHRMRDDVRSR
jgi:hypothetical protein